MSVITGANVASASGDFCGFKSDQERRLALGATLAQSGGDWQKQCAQDQDNEDKNADSPVAASARRLMAMMYGSCDVLDLKVRNLLEPREIPVKVVPMRSYRSRIIEKPAKIIESHPYLAYRGKPPCIDEKECKNPTGKYTLANECFYYSCFVMNHPPLFHYDGSMLDEATRDGEISNPFVKVTVDGQDSRGADKIRRESAVYDPPDFKKSKKQIEPVSSSATGFDCSGFTDAYFKMGGLYVTPGSAAKPGFPDLYETWDTAHYWNMGKGLKGNPADCFEDARNDQLKPGDIVVWKHDHMAMIDAVGNDPYGIEDLRDKIFSNPEKYEDDYRTILTKEQKRSVDGLPRFSDIFAGRDGRSAREQADYLVAFAWRTCKQKLSPKDFKVTILHSSDNGGSVGIQREKLIPGLAGDRDNTTLKNGFMQKIEQDCAVQLANAWAERLEQKHLQSGLSATLRLTGTSKSKDLIAEDRRVTEKGKEAHFIRHVNDPACHGPPKNVPGKECVAGCKVGAADYDQLVPPGSVVPDDNYDQITEMKQ